jgi:hypothetical protein
LNVCRPGQKPDELMDNGFEMELLRRNKRKSFLQVKAHLMRKNGNCTGAGAISFCCAMLLNMAHKVEILLHGA